MNKQLLTPRQALAQEVRVWMSRAGMKQSELAELLGVSLGAASRKYNGSSVFTFEELLAIAGHMDISLGELLGAGILNARIPKSEVLVGNGKGQKNAPVGFIPNGASYEVTLIGSELKTQRF